MKFKRFSLLFKTLISFVFVASLAQPLMASNVISFNSNSEIVKYTTATFCQFLLMNRLSADSPPGIVNSDSSDPKHLEDLISSGTIAAPSAGDENDTIEQLIKSGDISLPLSREKLLSLKVAPAAIPYFNFQNGRFEYATQDPFVLSLENGSAPLATLRHNIDGINLNQIFGHKFSQSLYPDAPKSRSQPEGVPDAGLFLILSDLNRVMTALPNVQVIITGPDASVIGDSENVGINTLLNDWLPNQHHRITLALHDDYELPPWAQDASKPRKAYRRTVIPRKGITMTVEQYESAIHALIDAGLVAGDRSIFPFEGGNIITGERHNFIGTNIIQATMKDFKISRHDALAALSTEFGAPVFEVGVPDAQGLLQQIDFHIDLSMAVAIDHVNGGEVVILESISEALKLFGIDDFEKLNEATFKEALQTAMLNHFNATVPRTGKEWSVLEKTFFERLSTISHASLKYREMQLKYVQRLLEVQNYRIVRIPGLNTIKTQSNKSSGVNGIFNYTNSILSERHAIVSRLGIRKLDEAAWKVYRSLGYSVIPVASPQVYFGRNGGFRCLMETYRCL